MDELQENRRFVAILAMDVVGYSQLVEHDELGTVRAVRRLRDDIIIPALDDNEGRIVKTMGDGFLAEFATASAAFASAVYIQKSCVEEAREAPANRRLMLRIGAHLGDVIVDEDDILGDGVNIAARLEGLAMPGGIATSATFARALQTSLADELVEDGVHRVKNISRPLTVWRWLGESCLVDPTTVNKSSRPPTIAVLPFVNRSTGSEQSFFADGLA
ncbi:MAG: adenylate/guanylate cyclase domain-containing protein, partial [Hyphomicrobiales bacterium]